MAKETSRRDPNYVPTLIGVDMTTGLLPTRVYVDETTHRLLVSAVITSQADSAFGINDIDDVTSTEYYGYSKTDAEYQIRKITNTGVTYATILNNSGTADYATAWANRATLTYGRFDEAF